MHGDRLFGIMFDTRSFIPNGVVLMPPGPAHAGGGRDAGPAGLPDEPVPALDWMTGAEWEAWCDLAAGAEGGPPPDLGWDEDPEPDPAGGERVAWTAGFGAGGLADGLPGGSELGSWLMWRPGTATGTRARRTPSWTG